MKPSVLKNILIVFWAFALLDIAGLGFNIPVLHIVFKPLLMPALITAVLLCGKAPGWKKIIIALIFSFLGDVFLLLPETEPLYFILGLSCFLLTHIFYILYFAGIKGTGGSVMKTRPYLLLLILAYTASLLFLLIPHLGDLMVPVIVYALVISTMVYFSLRVPHSTDQNARSLFIAGAVCFVVSDSLLAINKFYQQFPFAAIVIMFTYCLAQYFIVKGVIRTNK